MQLIGFWTTKMVKTTSDWIKGLMLAERSYIILTPGFVDKQNFSLDKI